MTRLFHSGDLGDIAYAMPIFRALGPCEVWIDDRPWTAKIVGQRFEIIKPLLEAQAYVSGVQCGTPQSPHLDVSTFRDGGHPFGERLTDLQARWLKVDISHDPWISVDPLEVSAGRVVVHRSPRYANPFFPWRKVAAHYGDALLAVGSPQEASALSESCGRKIEYLPTRDFLQLAGVVAGAELFIGNQSSPCAVAVGLGVPYVQETCLWTPDCLFPERQEAVHCIDGGIPGVCPPWEPQPEVHENETRPGGWRWVGPEGTRSRLTLLEAVRDSQLEKAEVIRQNVERLPGHFFRQNPERIFGGVQKKLLELSKKTAYYPHNHT